MKKDERKIIVMMKTVRLPPNRTDENFDCDCNPTYYLKYEQSDIEEHFTKFYDECCFLKS